MERQKTADRDSRPMHKFGELDFDSTERPSRECAILSV